jgi:two-component system, NarL family, sensor histidine kinase UhpB
MGTEATGKDLRRGKGHSGWRFPEELRIAGLYVLFAVLWILLSDRVVHAIAGNLSQESRLQTIKGIAFVVITAAWLLWLLRRAFKLRDSAIAQANSACERFELVARASNDAIYDWDLITNRIWWSDGFQNLFGYVMSELEPTIESWTNRVHPEDKERAVNGLHKAIESGRKYWSDEYRFRRKDGSYASLYDQGTIFHNEEGKPVRMLGGMMDITARKVAEEQLDLSRRQMRALSARLESLREEERTRISREVHDELGQLLTGLKMDVRWAEKRISEIDGHMPQLHPILDKLVEASELADQTIECVQKISEELRPGVLDNLGLATAIKHEAKRFQDRSGIACRTKLPEVFPDLKEKVATAMFRIFQETLTNIARHAKATEVDIELTQDKEHIVLEVRDNGQGISAENLANPRSLGLLGMKERATLLGGEIVFERATPQGTQVTLRIPELANDTSFWELV